MGMEFSKFSSSASFVTNEKSTSQQSRFPQAAVSFLSSLGSTTNGAQAELLLGPQFRLFESGTVLAAQHAHQGQL